MAESADYINSSNNLHFSSCMEQTQWEASPFSSNILTRSWWCNKMTRLSNKLLILILITMEMNLKWKDVTVGDLRSRTMALVPVQATCVNLRKRDGTRALSPKIDQLIGGIHYQAKAYNNSQPLSAIINCIICYS